MEDGYRFHRCLVGGTFDRFHAGHRLLLGAAERQAAHLEIHITSDRMADTKAANIESFETRREHLLQWIEQHAPQRGTVFELNDSQGPAPEHPSADCIVATPETRGQCEHINVLRKANNLQPLHIIEVEHLADHCGGIISSSRIRNGKIDTEGHPWVSSTMAQNVLLMHPGLDQELKTPMGTLFEGPEDAPDIAMYAALEDRSLGQNMLIAVGDVTVRTMLEIDIIPDIALIDGQTKRTQLPEHELVDTSSFAHSLSAENPPGTLTPSLLMALEKAIDEEEPCLIHVEGEEDLAPLYAHLLAPIGSIVVYGQPAQGVVVQLTSLATKERCRRLLEYFEVE